MTTLIRFRMFVLLTLAGAATTACGETAAPPADEGAGTVAAAPGDTGHAHGMPGMQMDHSAMQRHAHEADSAVAAMRGHVQQMRQLSAEQQHARVGEHVSHVSRMLSLMDRHMREMDHGMGMDDAQMGEMMGMTADEHRQMMEQMRTLRSEAERLQTASQAEIRQQMPGHLDRIESMLRMMEQSADHMRHR
jgi:hypothetical protein